MNDGKLTEFRPTTVEDAFVLSKEAGDKLIHIDVACTIIDVKFNINPLNLKGYLK